MYTRESVSTDRYNTGDESGSGRDEAQNTTTVSSDWSVRPSDDTAVDSTQTNSLSRLNPAATPFSFTGGAAVSAGGVLGTNDLVGAPGAGGLHHPRHHPGMISGSNLDGGMTPPIMSGGRGLGIGGGGLSVNGTSNGSTSNGGAGMGMEVGSPNSFSMMQNVMSVPYGMVGGHRQSSLPSRPAGGMMDFGVMHGGGMNPGNGPSRMGGGVGAGGITSPNSFLPPPGEDTDQQELLRLQQSNYRVKMLPPPLTYEVHRKIWSKNEYGDDNDDDTHGSVEQEEESLHSLVNEDPVDREQRLEAYKQIMLRWYSHIHVLEGKSEVAKRLVRVRRACPSMEEVIASLTNNPQQQQQQSGAVTNTTGSDGGDEDASLSQQQHQPPPAATVTRRSPSEPLDTEEVLATWSAQCWDWWQETVKRKPRRARKQGEIPLGAAPGLPTSASAPMVAAMGGSGLGDGPIPHSLSSRAMDMDVSSPHLGNGGPYSPHSPYTNHNSSGLDAATGHHGADVPTAPSYTSFTELSDEGAVDVAAGRSIGQSPQQQQQSRTSSHSSPQLPGQQQQQQRSTPPQQSSHSATPPASMFTTNGIRAAAPRTGNPDDFLENDHLTLAFTTELLKSLED
jgi:hypothetical protein